MFLLFRIFDSRYFKCLLFLFLLGTTVFADYTKKLDKIAGKMAKEIPQGRNVVVFNILKDGRTETQNSVDLAMNLSMKLATKGKKKFTVVDRATGEKLIYEEKKYTAKSLNSDELIELLEGFKANVGVVGQYQLLGNNLILENIRAVAVPSPERPPEIISSYDRLTIQLNPQDSLCIMQKEKPISHPPDSATKYFLTAVSDTNFVSAQLIDEAGKLLPDNRAKIGKYYRLKIDLQEDAFLYIFSYDQDNNTAYLLYPLTKEEDKSIKKGSCTIPHGDNAIEAKAPAGKNFVKIFATRKPIPIATPQSEDGRLISAELANFVQELMKLSSNDWSSYRIFIHIEEK